MATGRLSRVLLRWIAGAVDGVRAVRVSVGFNVDSVVEISDIVVSDDVTGAIKPHGGVRRQLRREFLTVDAIELGPEVSDPSEEMFRIVPAHEIAVGDVEVARTRVVREDTETDVLKAALLHGQPLRTRDE